MKKIDIFVKDYFGNMSSWGVEWSYFRSTTQFKTCKEVKKSFLEKYPQFTEENVKCSFATN
jgi:hypothetical protein